MRILIPFIVYACLGTTVEIWFTAFVDNYLAMSEGKSFDGRLFGYSYVWMSFIYGSAAFIIPAVFTLLKKYPLFFRLILGAFLILLVEFIAGGLLEFLTGSCPWKYDTGWHIMGWIRLDYIPAWMLFVFILEKVHLFLVNKDLA